VAGLGGGGAGGGGGGSRGFSTSTSPASRSTSTTAGGPAVGKAKLLELIQQFQTGAQQAGRGFGGVYQQMLGTVSGDTGQRAADIRQAYREQAARQQAGLQRLGLGGTTVAPTMRMGLARERGAALNRLTDEILRTKLGVMGTQASRQTGLQSQYLGLIGQLATTPTTGSFSQKVSGVLGGGKFYGPSGGMSSFRR